MTQTYQNSSSIKSFVFNLLSLGTTSFGLAQLRLDSNPMARKPTKHPSPSSEDGGTSQLGVDLTAGTLRLGRRDVELLPGYPALRFNAQIGIEMLSSCIVQLFYLFLYYFSAAQALRGLPESHQRAVTNAQAGPKTMASSKPQTYVQAYERFNLPIPHIRWHAGRDEACGYRLLIHGLEVEATGSFTSYWYMYGYYITARAASLATVALHGFINFDISFQKLGAGGHQRATMVMQRPVGIHKMCRFFTSHRLLWILIQIPLSQALPSLHLSQRFHPMMALTLAPRKNVSQESPSILAPRIIL